MQLNLEIGEDTWQQFGLASFTEVGACACRSIFAESSMAVQNFDAKSPPKGLKSDRAMSARAAQLSQREPEHEAFGLEPPPTTQDIKAMMAATAVRTLKEYESDAATVIAISERFGTLVKANATGRQDAADAGAMQAIVSASKKHAGDAAVMEKAIGAIGNLCCGTDAAGLARKQLAADSGALEIIVAGMKAHASAAPLQENAAATIGNIASNVDDAGLTRKQQAADAGALETLVSALTAHKEDPNVCEFACFAIGNLVRARGDDPDSGAATVRGQTRKEKAVELGVIPTVIAAMHAHMDAPRVQEYGSRAISNLTFRNDAFKQKAIEAGAMHDWLDGACTARVFVPDKEVEDVGKAAEALEIK